MIERLLARKEWKFFGVLPRADRQLAIAWWLARTMRARSSDPAAGLATVPAASPVASADRAR